MENVEQRQPCREIILNYTVSQKNWDPIKTDCKSDSGSQN